MKHQPLISHLYHTFLKFGNEGESFYYSASSKQISFVDDLPQDTVELPFDKIEFVITMMVEQETGTIYSYICPDNALIQLEELGDNDIEDYYQIEGINNYNESWD